MRLAGEERRRRTFKPMKWHEFAIHYAATFLWQVGFVRLGFWLMRKRIEWYVREGPWYED